VSSARNVVALKNSVPANWMIAAHRSAGPRASHICIPAPAVKSIEPTKNVAASAPGPTRST
jgi:hypothetical protein